MNNPETSAKPSRFIQLNFVNSSNNPRNTPVVVLQKNGANPESAIAWQVIQQFRPGDNYQLVFPVVNEVSVYDPFGHTTPFVEARPGNAFRMVVIPFKELRPDGNAHNPQAIEVTNALPQGVIDVQIFKGGAMLAVQQGLTPGQTASFVFGSSIFVGVVSPDIEEGQIITGDTLNNISTELSLEGIASADIVRRRRKRFNAVPVFAGECGDGVSEIRNTVHPHSDKHIKNEKHKGQQKCCPLLS